MIFEIASLVFSAVGAVCVAGCLCVGWVGLCDATSRIAEGLLAIWRRRAERECRFLWVGVKFETYIQCGRLPALLHFQLTRNPAIK